RASLAVLDGSCRTPIAGHAQIRDDIVTFRGEVLLPDGSESHTIALDGPRGDAAGLGRAAGEALKAKAGVDFFVRLMRQAGA
ncbi:hypothetical protein J8J40_25360, partial [Mycobacterium tuberculosis]|nr:hypothetical protein [Mycobacterium tuberculosis]